MTQHLTQQIVKECKIKLLEQKALLMERIRFMHQNLSTLETYGDETDRSVQLLTENTYLCHLKEFRERLLSIEDALARIERGTYGICRITEQPIEIDRLRAIPWTEFSIEGAEWIEAQQKRYAQ